MFAEASLMLRQPKQLMNLFDFVVNLSLPGLFLITTLLSFLTFLDSESHSAQRYFMIFLAISLKDSLSSSRVITACLSCCELSFCCHADCSVPQSVLPAMSIIGFKTLLIGNLWDSNGSLTVTFYLFFLLYFLRFLNWIFFRVTAHCVYSLFTYYTRI